MAASTQADLIGNRYGHLPYRRRVITVSTGSTATRDVAVQESGAILVIGTVSTAHLALPRISSNRLGLTYEFFVSTQDARLDITIASTIDSSADILIGGVTTAVSTASAISPGSTLTANFVRVTAISSVRWLAEAPVGFTTESSNTGLPNENFYGNWVAGTTQ